VLQREDIKKGNTKQLKQQTKSVSNICTLFVHTALYVVQCRQQDGKHGTSHLRENQTYDTQICLLRGCAAQSNNCAIHIKQATHHKGKEA